MDAALFAQPRILNQPIYQPGKPISHVAREFGLDPDCIDKLASNENPLGPSPKAQAAVQAALKELHLYPDGSSYELTGRLARHLGVGRDQIVLGNGSNELLELVAHAFLGPDSEAVIGCYGFVVYKLVSLLMGAKPVEVPMPNFHYDFKAMRAAVTDRTRVVFLDCPNNPTGTVVDEAELLSFVRSLPENVLFVLDEAYAEYRENPPDLRPLIAEGRAVICARTFSKIYGLAGLRVGYAYTRPDIASFLHRAREPFNVNSLAQAGALAALDDADFVKRSRETNRAGLEQLMQGFRALGLDCVPSGGNFILFKVGDGAAAFRHLQARGTIIRPVGGLPEYARVSVGTAQQNQRFLERLKAYLTSK